MITVIVSLVNGQRFVKQTRPILATLHTLTVPEMVKKHRTTKAANPWLGRVTKAARINVVLGGDYRSMVDNRRLKEAAPQTLEDLALIEAFEPMPRAWGVRRGRSPLVDHKGKVYVEAAVLRVYESGLLIDGEPASDDDAADVRQYLPHPKEEGARQEVERPVILRDYAMASLRAIAYAGELFAIEAGEPVAAS